MALLVQKRMGKRKIGGEEIKINFLMSPFRFYLFNFFRGSKAFPSTRVIRSIRRRNMRFFLLCSSCRRGKRSAPKTENDKKYFTFTFEGAFVPIAFFFLAFRFNGLGPRERCSGEFECAQLGEEIQHARQKAKAEQPPGMRNE